MAPGFAASAHMRNSSVNLAPDGAAQVNATASCPSRPRGFLSEKCRDEKGNRRDGERIRFLTTSHILTPQSARDGKRGYIALLCHTNAGPIALVDAIYEKSGECRVCCRKRGEGGRQTECEKKGMHRVVCNRPLGKEEKGPKKE